VELFHRLNAIPRLSRDEELALIRRAKAGDVDARGRVLTANLRVTCMVAMRYRHLLRDRIDDAIAHGTEGLIQAFSAFDPELDPEHRIRFATYAYDWVRRYIARPLFFRDDVVRRPEELLRSGTATWGSADVSLNAPVDREDGLTGLDMLASDLASPEDLVAEADDRCARDGALRAGLTRLDERCRYILTETIMSDEPRTVRHVAQQLGLSRQRVQQLRNRALLVLAGAGHHARPSPTTPSELAR
jgi:RNA polymerase sigma-32 factor